MLQTKAEESIRRQAVVIGSIFTLAGLVMAGTGAWLLISPIDEIPWPGSLFYIVLGLIVASFSWFCVVKLWGRKREADRRRGKRPEAKVSEISSHELATTRSMREATIRQQIDDIGREAFPDSPNTIWYVQEIVHKEEDLAIVEVEPKPSESIGWSRLKLGLHFDSDDEPSVAICYGSSDGLWNVVFHADGCDVSEFDRLVFHESGQPMPLPEREAWIREHLDGIGRNAYPEESAVSWILESMVHNGWYTFVESTPSPNDPIGFSRLKFVIRCEAAGQPETVGCFGLDESGWGVVWEVESRSEWEQLHEDENVSRE